MFYVHTPGIHYLFHILIIFLTLIWYDYLYISDNSVHHVLSIIAAEQCLFGVENTKNSNAALHLHFKFAF